MAAATSFWITGPGRSELRASTVPQPGPGEVLVQSRFGAISRGTERLVLAGRVPETEFERMRAPHQEGGFGFPIKYGYAVVGRVSAGAEELIGRDVFCLHPHQDRFVVPAGDVVPIPQDVPAERAVLAANMETALNVIWDARIGAGDRVAVIGGGLLGLLIAHLARRIPATTTTLVDVNAARASLVEALGLAFAKPEAAPADCDVVIHASATQEGLATAIAAAGFEARIVEMSWYGDETVRLALGGAFHSRRLSIVSSQVGAVPAGRRGRWDPRRRLETALSLLAQPALDRLVTGETAFGRLPSRYGAILDDPDTLCHRIRYMSEGDV